MHGRYRCAVLSHAYMYVSNPTPLASKLQVKPKRKIRIVLGSAIVWIPLHIVSPPEVVPQHRRNPVVLQVRRLVRRRRKPTRPPQIHKRRVEHAYAHHPLVASGARGEAHAGVCHRMKVFGTTVDDEVVVNSYPLVKFVDFSSSSSRRVHPASEAHEHGLRLSRGRLLSGIDSREKGLLLRVGFQADPESLGGTVVLGEGVVGADVELD
mmetsp:Transcript_1509/g.2574  ORF Transcript_1509/g.2574 Transcript_1509/m.2574 type:complete len:209 (+) Transcript_1509:245-871(+)